MKKLLLIFVSCLIHLGVSAESTNPEKANLFLKKYAKDIAFIPNNGQKEASVLFHAKTPQLDIRFMQDRINFGAYKNDSESYFTWEMVLDGTNQANPAGKDKRKEHFNYLRGKNKVHNVESYEEVWYDNAYNNIDLRFYSKGNGTVEYDFIVYPNGKTEDINFSFKGLDNYHINSEGEIIMETPLGDFQKGKPYTYQNIDGKEIEVKSKYILLPNGKISFELLEEYDPCHTLYIDPTVVEWSTFIGTWSSHYSDMYLHDGFFYIHAAARPDTPTTLGSGHNGPGQRDMVIMKFDTDGQLVFSTIIGGFGSEGKGGTKSSARFQYENNKIYIASTYERQDATTDDYPTTPDAFDTKGNIVYSILDDSGNLLYSTYIGLTDEDIELSGFKVLNGEVTIAVNDVYGNAYTTASSFQATHSGGTNQDLYVIKFDAANQYVFSSFIGGSEDEHIITGGQMGVHYDGLLMDSNGNTYVTMRTYSNDFPLTPSAAQNVFGGIRDIALTKFDNSGTVVYSTYLGGDGVDDFMETPILSGNDIYLISKTNSTDINTVNAFQSSHGGANDLFLHKLDANGNISFATYIGGDSNDSAGENNARGKVLIENGHLYINGVTSSSDFPTTTGAFQTSPSGSSDRFLLKMDLNGNLIYSTYIGGSGDDAANYSLSNRVNHNLFQIENGRIYISGQTYGNDFPTTSNILADINNAYPTTSKGFLAIFDETSMNPDHVIILSNDHMIVSNMAIGNNGKIVLSGSTGYNLDSYIMPTSLDALQTESWVGNTLDDFIMVLNTDGSICYSSYIGGSIAEVIEAKPQLFYDGENVYMFRPYSYSTDFPTTPGAFQDTRYEHGAFGTFTKFDTNYDDLSPNAITPETPIVCIGGDVGVINGSDVVYQNVPDIIRDGEVFPQILTLAYQWQVSMDNGATWSDIAGATTLDFKPAPLLQNTMFRRAIKSSCEGVDTYSNEIEITTNGLIAPEANGGGDFFSCPDVSIIIGGIATGGTPFPGGSYEYEWFPTESLDDSQLAQPNATGNTDIIYDVIVTDANGCTHQDQATLTYIQADAGADQFACQGSGVQIGTPMIPGSGSTFLWEPSTGLSADNIAQPIATPLIPTLYTLTTTLVNGCSTTSEVLVTPILFNFDMEDVYMCFDENITLGGSATPVSGYTYEWNNPYGLSSLVTPTTTYSPAAMSPPLFINTQDTIVKSLTITHAASGCSATEFVNIYINRANPGAANCIGGVTTLGVPDNSGGTASYTWSVVSGDTGSLAAGDVNNPQPIVNPTVPTTYQLSVIWNGITCTSQLDIPVCLDGCMVEIKPDSNVSCPIGKSNGITTVLNAQGVDSDKFTFVWSPASAVSSTTGPSVTVNTLSMATNISVTATSIEDPSITCTDDIDVYPSNFPLPELTALDGVICDGQAVMVGEAFEAGHNYVWDIDDPSLFDDPLSTNPMASPSTTTDFILIKYDNITGCSITDTSTVIVREPIVDAGPDREFCKNAIIELGTTAVPDQSYQWEPSGALFPSNIAQTIDTLLITTTYTVTATDDITGCTASDQITFTLTTAPEADAGNDVNICNGASATIGPGNSDPSYTYLWIPAVGLSNPNIPNPIASPTSSVDYTLFVSAAAGCFDSDAVSVTVNNCTPPPVDAGDDQYLCYPDMALIGTPDMSGGVNTYLWTPSTGLDDPTLPQPTVTATALEITYTLTVTGPAPDFLVNTDQVTVYTVLPPPTAEILATPCPNEATEIGYSFGSGYTYEWSPSTYLSADNVERPIFTGPTGEYSYMVTITGPDGCPFDGEAYIIVPGEADAGPDISNCGDTGVQIGSSGMPNGTFLWSPSSTLSDPSIKQPIATPTTTTTYTVTYIDSDSGCSSTSSVTVSPSVSVNINPNGGNNLDICIGESTVIGEPDSSGGLWTYTWSVITGDASSLSSSSDVQPTITPSSTTTYQVEVSDGIDCTRTGEVTVNVDAPSIDLGSDITLCTNACTTVGTTAQVSHIYQWSPVDGVANPNTATTTICPSESTTYTLNVTNLSTGCTASDQILINVFNSPIPDVDAGDDASLCLNDFTIIGSTPLVGNFSYVWTPNTGLSNPYIAQPTATMGNSDITYTLTVTNNITGCFNSDEITLTRCDISPPNLNDVTICTGGDITIGPFSNNSGYSYSWTPTLGLNDSNIYNPIASPSITTVYTLQITEIATGVSLFANQTVTVLHNPAINVNAGNDVEICKGDSFVIGETDPGLGYTYSWSPTTYLSPSGTVSEVTVNPNATWSGGTYTVTASNGICSASDEVTIIARNEAILTSGGNKTICVSEGETNLDATISDGYGIWSLSSGPNTPSISSPGHPSSLVTGLIEGTYIFNWTANGNFCNTGDFAEMRIEVMPSPSLTITNPSPIACFNGSTDLTASAVTSGSSLNGGILTYWMDNLCTIPLSDPTNVGGFGGVFYIKARTAAGCEDIQPVTVSSRCELPVEMLYFKATGNCPIALEWATASEENNAYFIVERSKDGSQFERIGTVRGNGNSVEEITYQYKEKDLLVEGLYYYRLKQVDYDGTSAYSNIVVVRSTCKINLKGKVYPNPNFGQFTYSFENDGSFPEVDITIYNALGQLILNQKLTTESGESLNKFEIQDVTPGLYMMKVREVNGNIIDQQKLIISAD